jgi:CubicO group peptidase (beta-lactamase class C family)
MRSLHIIALRNFSTIFLTLAVHLAFAQQLTYDSIDLAIEKFMAERHIPGFATCVVKDSTISWSGTYGKADVEADIPMSLDRIMNIGSISKTFTATAILQLWEKGRLDLDANVNQYLDFSIRNPSYPDTPITIFQLLTHTSSIQDGTAYGESYACGDPSVSLYDWIDHYFTPDGNYYKADENFADWSPGSKRRYSNVGFGLLGLIVEEVAGQPFNEYCQANIFAPLGMKNTGWMLGEVDTANYISLYGFLTEQNREGYMSYHDLFPGEKEFAAGTLVQCCLYSFPNYPDGLVRTSVRELSYFMTAIMNGGMLHGQRILNEETVEEMLTLQLEDNDSQGLCWDKEMLNDETALWGHNGGDPGVATNMYFNREQKIGFITFQNSITGGAFEIIRKLYLVHK